MLSPLVRIMAVVLFVGGIIAAQEVRIALERAQSADLRAQLAGYVVAVHAQAEGMRQFQADADAAVRRATAAARVALSHKPKLAQGTGPAAMNQWLRDTLSP